MARRSPSPSRRGAAPGAPAAASTPTLWDDAGDPTSANYGTWSYTNGKLVETDEVIPVSGQ